jgi:hypothetical protein
MLLIILLSVIALGVSGYFVQKATIKRYERRERLKERRKQLFDLSGILIRESPGLSTILFIHF